MSNNFVIALLSNFSIPLIYSTLKITLKHVLAILRNIYYVKRRKYLRSTRDINSLRMILSVRYRFNYERAKIINGVEHK